MELTVFLLFFVVTVLALSNCIAPRGTAIRLKTRIGL
jgi:hypothetical protein